MTCRQVSPFCTPHASLILHVLTDLSPYISVATAQLEGRQQSLSARQESVEASSRQVLSTKMGSGESYMGGLSRAQIAGGLLAAAPEHSPVPSMNDGVPSGQALASQLNSSSFAKEQVRLPPPDHQKCHACETPALLVVEPGGRPGCARG